MRLARNLRRGTDSLLSAISSCRIFFIEKAGLCAEKTSQFLTWSRYAAVAMGGHVRATGVRVRVAILVYWRRGLSAVFVVRRGLLAIRRYLLAGLTQFRAVANREVELPRIDLTPFFRAMGTLVVVVSIAAISIGVAGFITWQMSHNIEPPAPVASRDHHPPARDPSLASPRPALAPPMDAESDFVSLARGPEDDMAAREPRNIANIPDIDAENIYAGDAIDAPEDELVVAALSPTPRARPRPSVRPAPLVTGIPILPDPPEGMGTQPLWLANAVEPRYQGNGPMIAIVIDDVGVAQARTARAINLPAPLTFAFIPYSNNLERQAGAARRRGHELLLHIPMEPGDASIDPGHNALLTSLGRKEIMRRFQWALNRFDGYVGVNNHMGSKFMSRRDLVQPVLDEINARGLLFLDSRTDHRSVGARLAGEMGMPHAARNVFIDNDLDAAKIRAQLAKVEQVARRRGHAIAIGHPHDVTTDVLAKWIPEARRRGFVMVPVSTIVKQEFGPRLAAASAGGEADGLLGGAQ